MHGTVFVPAKPPAFAAAVWVDGAGRKTRNIGLAQLFAKRGIALLTYDKRGVGASGGVYAGPEAGTNNVSRENLALAEDAATAIRALRQERKLSNVPRGFIGGSQAGWIIAAAALKYREARFIVNGRRRLTGYAANRRRTITKRKLTVFRVGSSTCAVSSWSRLDAAC